MKDDIEIPLGEVAALTPDEKIDDNTLRVYDPKDITVTDIKNNMNDLAVRMNTLTQDRFSTQESIRVNNEALQVKIAEYDAQIQEVVDQVRKNQEILARAAKAGIII